MGVEQDLDLGRHGSERERLLDGELLPSERAREERLQDRALIRWDPTERGIARQDRRVARRGDDRVEPRVAGDQLEIAIDRKHDRVDVLDQRQPRLARLLERRARRVARDERLATRLIEHPRGGPHDQDQDHVTPDLRDRADRLRREHVPRQRGQGQHQRRHGRDDDEHDAHPRPHEQRRDHAGDAQPVEDLALPATLPDGGQDDDDGPDEDRRSGREVCSSDPWEQREIDRVEHAGQGEQRHDRWPPGEREQRADGRADREQHVGGRDQAAAAALVFGQRAEPRTQELVDEGRAPQRVPPTS